jgi:hypothetical protein
MFFTNLVDDQIVIDLISKAIKDAEKDRLSYII